jgi:hypothetical protein
MFRLARIHIVNKQHYLQYYARCPLPPNQFGFAAFTTMKPPMKQDPPHVSNDNQILNDEKKETTTAINTTR